MTTKMQAVPRSGPPRRLPILVVSALALAALAGLGCNPDIPQNGIPAFVELEFDPSSSPPKSYEPNLLVTNPETGLLDFSAAGMAIPADPLECGTQTAMPVASCEFYWYLQQLDGFPTLTPARTPVSAPIDLATVTLPGNLFIYEFMRGTAPVTEGTVTDKDGYLKFDPAGGWDIGGLYLVAVRGYENGIKDTSGDEAVKSIIYVLLQQDNPLTCGITDATDPALPNCGFYSLFSGDARFRDLPAGEKEATILATLAQLEQLRQLYKGEVGLPFDVWTQVEEKGQMPPAEVGILWAFRTHTASVVELNPNTGLAPVVASPTEIHLTPKGPIDATTLKPFSLSDPTGDVFLLDGTAFLGGDFLAALPTFTVASTEGDIVLTLDAPLVEGHLYIMVLSNEVEGKPGKPIVPSPVTVFLRSRGALVDNFDLCATDPPTATPQAPGLEPADACQLEAGRQQFVALLDNETVTQLTTNANRPEGLTREIVAYLYGFEYTAQ
jgi:hypothetical protein